MAKSLKGTKTLENLMKSFAGESQARGRYTMFAGVAGKEGYDQIGAFFLDTADNERIHAKEFYKFITETLEPGEEINVDIQAGYPATMGNTLQNLYAAARGEHEEYTVLYSEFADVADKEGFTVIADTFRKIGDVEAHHEARYLALAHNIEKGLVFSRPEAIQWKCRKCGHIHTDTDAPKVCPICKHPQGYFEMYTQNY